MGDAWAAYVEHREEGGLQTGATREAAIASAMEDVLLDCEDGWDDPGRRAVHVYRGCEWHERCNDEDCEYCADLDPDHDFVLVERAGSERVEVEVYAQSEDDDGPCDFAWREVCDG